MNTTSKLNWTISLVTMLLTCARHLRSASPANDDAGDNLDDPELWHDLTLEEQQTVNAAMAKKQRLQCFAHTHCSWLWETV